MFPCGGCYANFSTLALKAAAQRILADWNAYPDAARISESDCICAEARRKLERYAALP